MVAPPVVLSLSALVSATGVPASTIHHYRRQGLIPPPQRAASNRFCYDERHVETLRLIRRLRQAQGMGLDAIADALPGLLADPLGVDAREAPADVAARLVNCATELFRIQSYAEVTVGDVADRAGVAKGRVYRYFASKEDLFDAVVEQLLASTSANFAAAVDSLGGPEGIAHDPDRTAEVFAGMVAGAMPILLELGARAAKGHPSSGTLARRVLRTLAEAIGTALGADDTVCAGLGVIDRAFAKVLDWAVTPDWEIAPPDSPPPGDGA